MNLLTVTYLVYLAISISLTVWVARTLFRNGRLFLVEVFYEVNARLPEDAGGDSAVLQPLKEVWT